MKFNFACLLLISSASALHVDDLNTLNTCGERKQEDFPVSILIGDCLLLLFTPSQRECIDLQFTHSQASRAADA